VTLAGAGVTAIDSNAGAVTVNVTGVEVIPPVEAVTVVLPCAKVVATPLALIVATEVLVDAQITEPDTSAELVSE
jgi:hypothetical protein